MPKDTVLSANLTAPKGGKSLEYQELSSKPVDLVSGIGEVAQSNIAIAYKFTATIKAGIIAPTTKTITYTIADSK